MNSSTVSARKYRPTLFEEIKGQGQVTKTLLNQLKSEKIPQVVLFCGPRGSGKTSCARLFAKAINCTARKATGEPCNACMSCKQFIQGTSINIHELDAASNSSVDDVRQLLEQVRYHPPFGKRALIIDEIHVLSNAAFNALLKTLEEPPSHVVFILATTEKHKILPTVLSRCQVFDFYPIPAEEMLTQLQYIAKKEGIEADEEALHLIIGQSEGSFREALHAFDKIVAFSGENRLSKEAVLENLQIIDASYYFKITQALYENAIGKAFKQYDALLRLGFDSQHFIKGLTKHFRNLIVVQTTDAEALLHAAASMRDRYQVQSEKITLTWLYNALIILEQCELHYRERQEKRLHVEITLVKIANLSSTEPKRTIGDKISAAPSSGTKTATKERATSNHSPKKIVPQPTTQTTLQKNHPQTKPHPDKEKIEVPTSQKIATQALTLAKITKPWQAYREKLKQKGAMSAYATMNGPIQLEGNTLVLQITNSLQSNTLRSHQDDLLTFLHNALDGEEIKLTTRVSPLNTEQVTTQADKLQNLTQRYPAVQTLKESLKLV